MSKNIFITREVPAEVAALLTGKGYEVDMNLGKSMPSQDELIAFLQKKNYDGVVTLLTDKIDAKVFEAVPSVKIYANYATGFDNINIEDAKAKGVAVTNAPAPLTSDSVAEHTLAFILALAKKIIPGNDFVRAGLYKGWSAMDFMSSSISGKTLGLVGAGRIGYKVAAFGKALGFKVIYFDVKPNEAIDKENIAAYYPKVEDVLKEADFVSLHVPLLDSTKHLMNEEKLGMMKKTGYLINTSRGPVIDEAALVKVLKEGAIAGAALDVYEFEPNLSPGLAELTNVVFTPHIASASTEVRAQMSEITVNNLVDFFEGRTPANLLTK
jgi:glyoxylate reductase